MRYFYFFSYGSNLLFERIHQRVDTVEVVTNHILSGYKIVFNKISTDGSAKANVVSSKHNEVFGVIHKVEFSQKHIIDGYEGLGKGYDLQFFDKEINEESKKVGFYVATEQKYLSEDQPYCWYLDFVIKGAYQNGFPKSYIEKIEKIPCKKDVNPDRSKENIRILNRYQGT